MRIEKDLLGALNIEDNALYGIHSLRAKANFAYTSPFPLIWYKNIALIKKAYYLTYKRFKAKAIEKYPSKIKFIEDNKIDALINAADELIKGEHFNHFIVPAISGGAGTSINLNINEIITNKALEHLNFKYGSYEIIDPIEEANIYQSTNDVIPSALKISIITLLKELETSILALSKVFEKKEQAFKDILRISYTETKEATPSTYGRLFSTYSEAFTRDWWRISKAFERIKTLNLGAGASGSGLSIPQFFIFEVYNVLKDLVDLPIARADNLNDNTSNLDSLVEAHSIIKVMAVNFEKTSADLRLLSSDLAKKISIPPLQTGSSIMPNKVNPVMFEYAISIAHKIYANDILITNLAAQGNLDLNPYLPIIGASFIESIELLISLSNVFKNTVKDIKVLSEDNIYKSLSIVTALAPYLGYNKCKEISKYMETNSINIFTANRDLSFINNEKLKEILKPSNLLSLGFKLSDL